MHLYIYASANPILYKDKSGEFYTINEMQQAVAIIAYIFARIAPAVLACIRMPNIINIISSLSNIIIRFNMLVGRNLSLLRRFGYNTFE